MEKAAGELSEARDLHHGTGNAWGEARTLCSLARLERRRGDLVAAQAAVAASLELVESLRGSLSTPGLRTSLSGSLREAFELDVDLKMELERREPGRGHAGEALAASERARARTLLELLREAGADIRQGVDPALREREQSIEERLNAKASRQVEVLSGNALEPQKEAARHEVETLLRELEGVQAEIRLHNPRYAALTQPRPIALSEIQALLDGRTLLLEYALGDERSFLWAVGRDSLAAFELPPRAEIEAVARTVYDQMRIVRAGSPPEPQAAARLSHMLLGAVAPQLGDKRLAIVADGALQYIPFAALPDPADRGAGGGAAPLLARHEVVDLPSASVLAVERGAHAGRVAAPRLAAIFADPVFDRADPRLRSAGPLAPQAAARPGTLRGGGGSIPLERLPATRREAEAIAALAPAGQVLLALDFRASRAAALAPELADFRILHFATHGLIDTATPALSGLVLSRVAADGSPQNGFLGLEDVYNLHLSADLVVLSGCDTALGREIRGEGLVGLTQGFFYAGARRMVASLWPVQDRATALLMTGFYRAMLVEGLPPAAALRAAQLAVWRQALFRAPVFWAPFVLLGDWD